MKTVIRIAIVATALFAPHFPAAASGFKFSSTDEKPLPVEKPSAAAASASTAAQLRCGQGDMSAYPEKIFVSYLSKANYFGERIFLEKAYVCVKENSVDTEEGLRDLFARLTGDSRKEVIAPLMIQRMKN